MAHGKNSRRQQWRQSPRTRRRPRSSSESAQPNPTSTPQPCVKGSSSTLSHAALARASPEHDHLGITNRPPSRRADMIYPLNRQTLGELQSSLGEEVVEESETEEEEGWVKPVRTIHKKSAMSMPLRSSRQTHRDSPGREKARRQAVATLSKTRGKQFSRQKARVAKTAQNKIEPPRRSKRIAAILARHQEANETSHQKHVTGSGG
ncbi:uncharacterized protein B0I36DRAFT_55484 [Microdochium trichocladiopsis]|uniref:Uncharacterized protein n=1 Tax=Microdochium trichocladiopsis TaxID=1682393 RepID=A0A9P9BHG7_9PEZI|nr:uncharacterized protein B0I36DRAFT_55484 [Microdochium trichocladiopsis]KAH7010757.1 hypothetical protein B0I36DRAFT_55484 [Microdochium trichocladiopsis]